MKVDSPSGGIDCRSGGLNIQVEGKTEDEEEDSEITLKTEPKNLEILATEEVRNHKFATHSSC